MVCFNLKICQTAKLNSPLKFPLYNSYQEMLLHVCVVQFNKQVTSF